MVNSTLSSSLMVLGYTAEGSFGEDVSTYANRVTCATIDFSGLSQEMIEPGALQQRQNDGTFMIRGAQEGSFTMECDVYGHGSTTSGSLTETPLFKLLAYALGGSDSTQVMKVVDSTWSDTNTGDVVAGATIPRGSIVNFGALGDGYGEGQACAVDDFATPNISLLNNAAGIPQSGSAVYGNQMLYSTDSADVSSLRFWIGSGNQQYWVRGAACTAIAFSNLAEGQVPRVSMTWSCASWEEANETFPSVTAETDSSAIPASAGSLFINDFGTATRATYVPNDFALELDYQVVPLTGPGGVFQNQKITGWRRHKTGVKASFTFEAAASSSHDWADWWNTSELTVAAKHVLYTLSIVDGNRLSIYLPRVVPSGQRFKQVAAGDNTNRVTVEVIGYNSTATTTDQSLSNVRIALG